MVKWIIPSMVPVVKEAVARIRNATDAAREVARWYESNPTKVYLPVELEHFRGDTLLTKSDMVQLFNLSSEDSVNFGSTNWRAGCVQHFINLRGYLMGQMESV